MVGGVEQQCRHLRNEHNGVTTLVGCVGALQKAVILCMLRSVSGRRRVRAARPEVGRRRRRMLIGKSSESPSSARPARKVRQAMEEVTAMLCLCTHLARSESERVRSRFDGRTIERSRFRVARQHQAAGREIIVGVCPLVSLLGKRYDRLECRVPLPARRRKSVNCAPCTSKSRRAHPPSGVGFAGS